MHLARRAHVLVLLAAVLAVIGVWYQGDLARLWRIPAGLLLLGLAVEGALVRRAPPEAHGLHQGDAVASCAQGRSHVVLARPVGRKRNSDACRPGVRDIAGAEKRASSRSSMRRRPR